MNKIEFPVIALFITYLSAGLSYGLFLGSYLVTNFQYRIFLILMAGLFSLLEILGVISFIILKLRNWESGRE